MFEKTEKKSQTSKNTCFLTDVSRYKIHQAIRVKTDIMILSVVINILWLERKGFKGCEKWRGWIIDTKM